MIKSKKLDLVKTQNLTKPNFSEMDFLTFKVKKAFIYLQKIFIKVLILHYFDLEHHIYIETDISRYIIDSLLSQITSNQLFFNHVSYKNYFDFSKSEISQ